MNDLQQKRALSPPPPPCPHAPPSANFCSSNGGLGNNNNMNLNLNVNSSSSSSSNCFSPSSVSAPPLASSTYPWGTWEDLLLASAVLKHGIDNWSTVSCELQARAFLVPPSLFSAEACKGRFWILNGRFSSCCNGTIGEGKIPWFEEVRKLRVAQLKRELELYDGSIGLLQKKLNQLKAERGGSETITSNDTPEQHNPSGLAPDEVERCLQVSSAGDRMPAEKPLGIPLDAMSAPETVKSSCTSASPVMTGDGGLETTCSVPALQGSSALESASCNVSLSGPVIEGILDQHPTTIEGCQNSERISELTTIEVQHETLEPQVCPYRILEVKMSSTLIKDVEDECHTQNITQPLTAASESCEPLPSVIGAQDNYVPATEAVEKSESEAFQGDMLEMEKCTDRCEELEDGALAVKATIPFENPTGIERSVDVEVGGFAAEDTGLLCSPAQMESLVDIDVTQMESHQCQELRLSSATAQTGNVLKEDDSIDDSFISASAMDLLRIAYADGTPVSTPEAAEAQPVEPEDEVKEADSLCPSLDHKSAVHETNLIGSSVLEVPCQGTVKELETELETTEQNQIVGIQTTVHKVSNPKEVISVKAAVPDLAVALESEHVSEQVCLVEGLAKTITVLSEITEISNIMADQAKTGLSQDVGVGTHLIPKQTFKLELDSESSASQKGKSSILQEEIIKQEIQDLGTGAGADNLECCKNLGENVSSDGRACLEMVEEKGEDKPCEEGCKQEVDSVATEKIPNRIVSDLDLLVEHPGGTVKEMDDANQVIFCGSQFVVEPKKRPGTPMDSSSAISGLAFAEHLPAVYGGLYEADSQVQKASPCDSDGRSSVVEAVSESVNKQEKSDPEGAEPGSLFRVENEFLKVNCPNVEGKMPEMVSEPKTIHKQAKLEEGSVRMLGSKLSSDPGLSSPHLKAEHSADIDVLEEDGLLVDLMKLKSTDLTNLRKRKHLHRSGSSVDAIKDYGAPKERLDEILDHKQLKLPRSQEEDRKARLPDAFKDSGNFKKLKLEFRGLDGPGEDLNQASLSSNVSIVESHDQPRSKESAIEVFSTRRSRLKLRKMESASEEPDKAKRRKDGSLKNSEFMMKDGSVKKSEDMILDVGDEESSRLEVSGLVSPDGKPVTRLESTDNRLLPDLVILLECLRTISGHRFAPLFKLRPEIQGDAKYRVLIKKHMDLNTVRNKLEEGRYSGSLEFFRDMMLIFSNALVFYSRESQEYGAARVLRESLIREMERYLKKECTHGSPGAMQAVKYNESKVLKDFNMSTSVTTSDGKRQGSIKSSYDHMNCEAELDGEVDTNEVTLVTRACAKDSGLETSKCVNDLDWKKKDRGVKVSSKAFSRVKTTRTKANEREDDRPNMISGTKEKVSREKHQRIPEDGNTKVSIKKESVTLSQGSKRPYQISSRSSRDYTPKRETSDKSRSSKYSSGRQVSVPQGREEEPRKSLGGGRSSRSAQQSKQTYSRGNHSLSQPQKRARM